MLGDREEGRVAGWETGRSRAKKWKRPSVEQERAAGSVDVSHSRQSERLERRSINFPSRVFVGLALVLHWSYVGLT